MSMIEIIIPGKPIPQGSMISYGKGRMVYRDDLKPWRTKVRAEYVRQSGSRTINGAAHMTLEFAMPRPKSHYGTGANAGRIKESYRDAQHTVKPDLDKLIRAVSDALTLDKGELAGLPRPFKDDAQIASYAPLKRYVKEGENPHARIEIRPHYAP